MRDDETRVDEQSLGEALEDADAREGDTRPGEVKYPDVKVKLTGTDSNAFFVMGKVTRALTAAGHGDKVEQFMQEATASDYDNVLVTCMRWVDVS